MIKEYKADTDRVYLTGLIMGGYVAGFTAMARSDLFASIAPVCGGGMAWCVYSEKKLPIGAFRGVAINFNTTEVQK